MNAILPPLRVMPMIIEVMATGWGEGRQWVRMWRRQIGHSPEGSSQSGQALGLMGPKPGSVAVLSA